eukprot:4385531-Lingulodinium_polyedra.AAC.1
MLRKPAYRNAPRPPQRPEPHLLPPISLVAGTANTAMFNGEDGYRGAGGKLFAVACTFPWR